MTSPADQTTPDFNKLSAKEFKDIAVWILSLVFSVSKKHSLIYFTTTTIEKLIPIIWAYIFSKILDYVIQAASTKTVDRTALVQIALILVVYVFVSSVISLLRQLAENKLNMNGMPLVKQLYAEKLNSLGIQTLEHPDINDRMHRANEYVTKIVTYYIQLIQLLTDVVAFIIAAYIIFVQYPVVGVIIVLVQIPGYYYDKRMRTVLYQFDFKITEAHRVANAHYLKVISSVDLTEITIVRGFRFLLDKFVNYQKYYLGEYFKIWNRWRIPSETLGFFSESVTYLTYIYFFVLAIIGKITIGDVTFMVRTISTVQARLGGLSRNLSQLMESSLRFKDTYTLFNAEPLFADGSVELPKLEKGPEISFKAVAFSYPTSDRIIFENLNLHIKSGEKIAIVGQNGAGKTTLAKLIARFYKVESGEITVNGTNIIDLSADSLYRNYGVLWQDYNTYPNLSVKDNIFIGDTSTDFDEQRFLNAVAAADVDSFVDNYPNKFDTILSEKVKGGIRPSTGQWQKIAIARFFYRNAPLVIFDEPTASIDAVSEYTIFKNIYEFFTGKTVIIISHRFSTVRNADRILVMDHGKIIEEGSHDELMALEGKYAEAFKLQAEGYKEKVEKII